MGLILRKARFSFDLYNDFPTLAKNMFFFFSNPLSLPKTTPCLLHCCTKLNLIEKPFVNEVLYSLYSYVQFCKKRRSTKNLK